MIPYAARVLLAAVIMIGWGPLEVYSMEARIAKQGVYGTAHRATRLVIWRFPDFE